MRNDEVVAADAACAARVQWIVPRGQRSRVEVVSDVVSRHRRRRVQRAPTAGRSSRGVGQTRGGGSTAGVGMAFGFGCDAFVVKVVDSGGGFVEEGEVAVGFGFVAVVEEGWAFTAAAV